ncbi:MAG: hypothetical protein HQL71_06015 [Magnetococcales bacterium]|nr:hypothetical protein [Magnetococcales bacterium]
MKHFIPSYHRTTVIGGFVILFCMLSLLPLSDALAVGNWSYPKSEAERQKREDRLESQLIEQEKNYQAQAEVVSQKQSELTDLIERIKVAKINLKFKNKPLQDAIKKYRQVQSLSLVDPMVSTEPQRMELLEVKRETAALVNAHKEKLKILTEQLPIARTRVENAIKRHNFILKEIDSLMRHRDTVRELVFVSIVAD